MEAYTRSLMCGSTNNNFSHVASRRMPARCLRVPQILWLRSFFAKKCSDLARGCPCAVYVPILAEHTYHEAYSIHMQCVHKTTGGEFECSSVCPVGTSGLQETYSYLQCLLMALRAHSLSTFTRTLTRLRHERTHLPPPLAQTHINNAGLSLNDTPICLHTPNPHTPLRAALLTSW